MDQAKTIFLESLSCCGSLESDFSTDLRPDLSANEATQANKANSKNGIVREVTVIATDYRLAEFLMSSHSLLNQVKFYLNTNSNTEFRLIS